jgi:hypothetical protein
MHELGVIFDGPLEVLWFVTKLFFLGINSELNSNYCFFEILILLFQLLDIDPIFFSSAFLGRNAADRLLPCKSGLFGGL